MHKSSGIVNSYNEWDPLEEVIVGVMDGAAVPPWHVMLKATLPARHWEFFQTYGGQLFPPEMISAANRDLDELARILEAEGVIVGRPDSVNHSRPYSTPHWSSASGFYAAMPRDVLLVAGDEIIESPMPWRSRYFEVSPYRSLIKKYFRAGARWGAAPKPDLRDELYDADYEVPRDDEPMRYVTGESEPVFDAADFIRCGRDIFYIRSHTTNDFGVAWLERHLQGRFELHCLPCRDTKPMHIDTTYMPVGRRRMLVNPERVDTVPPVLRDWEILWAPPPCTSDRVQLYMSGKWLSMNVLMLDEERVIVAGHEKTLIDSFKRWGFKPIPCPFLGFYPFGGSIHCATLDIRRRGVPEASYERP